LGRLWEKWQLSSNSQPKSPLPSSQWSIAVVYLMKAMLGLAIAVADLDNITIYGDFKN
jgi:hypothetical protein